MFKLMIQQKKLPDVCKSTAIRLLPVTLFLIVTYAVYTPSSLFLSNIDEFSLHYINLVPIYLCVSLLLAAVIYAVAFFLIKEKHLPIFIAILFSLSLSLYFQGNFLNPDLPTLDGTEIKWEIYRAENIISTGFWIMSLLICLSLVYLRKEKTEKFIKYISYFLSAVQLVSLVVLILMTDRNVSQSGYSKIDQFSIGSEENIILFVLDTLDADAMKEYIASDACTDGTLDDFTFFDNTVAGGATTVVALPTLLTGIEYDPTQTFNVYNQEIWQETEFYNDLHNNGYDVRFFTEHRYFKDPPVGVAENFEPTGRYRISDYPVFTLRYFKLVCYYLMPQCVKRHFLISDRLMMEPVNDGRFQYNDVVFYSELQTVESLTTKYEKTFRFYHLDGVHTPFYYDENLEYIGNRTVEEQQVLQGSMKIVYDYIDKLKQTDAYEKSTIIVLGDHGRHELGNIESNPAVLIKMPFETHEFSYNSSPIHFRNVLATMAGTVVEDYSHYGPSVYDITENSDVERLHTIHNVIRERNNLVDAYNTDTKYSRLIINGRADSSNYRIWNPYEINRVRYQIGDIIDFTRENPYADQIDYRLYRENGAAIASNELSICFEPEHYQQTDLEFHFTYSGLYNDSQKMMLYANGNKLESIICTEDGIGQDHVCVISKDYIKDGKLVLRMVFPGAVTPNQLDRSNEDTRVLSVAFTSMWLEG